MAILSTATSKAAIDDGGHRAATWVTSYSSIFFAEVKEARASEWDARTPQSRVISVHLRLTRILRDEREEGLATGDFTANLIQARSPAGRIGRVPHFWSHTTVQVGQKYVVFSNLKTNSSAAMFEAPDAAELVEENSQVIADIELVLATTRASLLQQAEAVAVTLRESSVPRSHFLAEYAAAILGAGSDAETGQLTKALEETSGSIFSDEGKRSLLWALFQESRRIDSPSRNLLDVFTTLTVREFVSGSGAVPTPQQVNIL